MVGPAAIEELLQWARREFGMDNRSLVDRYRDPSSEAPAQKVVGGRHDSR